MAKTLGVSYDVLKDLEEELIDKGEMTKENCQEFLVLEISDRANRN